MLLFLYKKLSDEVMMLSSELQKLKAVSGVELRENDWILNSTKINVASMISNIRKSLLKGVALCVIIKNENLYLKEWVEHYKKIGISKIILYDNNDENGEKIEEIIQEDIVSEYVEVINYKGRGKCVQCEAFDNCYKTNQKKFEWLLFLDLDEFLHIQSGVPLEKFLSNRRFDGCDAVGINWKTYGDNGLVYYDNRSLKRDLEVKSLISTRT